MRRRHFLPLSALVSAAIVSNAWAQTAPVPAGLPGLYDGSQPEVAAQLELRTDGRFRYGLSYGALDEEAQGTWIYDSGTVRLTSDPVTAPVFDNISSAPGQSGRFAVTLDVPPNIGREFFDVLLRMSDGSTRAGHFTPDGFDLAVPAGARVVEAVVSLPLFDIESGPIPVGEGLHAVSVRFVPNDIGKVAFAAEPMQYVQGGLILKRLGGMVVFRKVRRTVQP